MKTTNQTKLIYVIAAVLFILVLTVFPDKDKNESPAPEDLNISSVPGKPKTTVADHVSNDKPDVLNTGTTTSQTHVISTFKPQCLDQLDMATELINDGNISLHTQDEITAIFNACVYEIENELALTEKSFSHSVEDALCLNSVNVIRDYLLDLGTDAQRFGDLPNSTEIDRSNISSSFARISNEIISIGGSAMTNRTVNCSRDS